MQQRFCLQGETFIASWSDVTKRLKILKPQLTTTNELQWEIYFFSPHSRDLIGKHFSVECFWFANPFSLPHALNLSSQEQAPGPRSPILLPKSHSRQSGAKGQAAALHAWRRCSLLGAPLAPLFQI